MKFLWEVIDNTFTHDDHEYSLTKLNKVVKNNPVKDIPISKLIWIFKYDDPRNDHPERIKTANVKVPILVTPWKSQIVVLDGLHRLRRAQMAGLKTLPSKAVSVAQLRQALIKEKK